MLHRLFNTPDPIVGILIAMAIGATLALVVGALFARHGREPIRWRRLILAVALSFGVATIGLALNFMTTPNPPPAVWPFAAITMPGVLAMNIFGRRSLEDLPFFGGFVLNVLLWSACAYALLRRYQRA